jgi:Ca-activated chloride channel family protein
MSAPETSEPRASVPDPRHERLCAYVFGELQGAERAALEAELARDPKLAAERERLEATAALVKGALPAEKLPASIRATLARAAERGPERRRFTFLRGGRVLARAAAALLVLFGGFFAWRAFQEPGLLGRTAEELARTTPRAAQAPEGGPRSLDLANRLEARRIAEPPSESFAESQGRGALRGLGYVGGEGSHQLRFKQAQASPQALEMLQLGYQGSVPSDTETDALLGQEIAAGEVLSLGRENEPADLAMAVGVGGGTGGAAAAPARTGIALAGKRELSKAAEFERDLSALGYGRAPAESGESSLATSLGVPAVPPAAPESLPVKDEIRLRERLDMAADQARRAVNSRRPALTPEDLAALQERTLSALRIQPGETPAMMFFRCWGDHPFVATSADRLSTFGIDVDTASYTLARRYLADGLLPSKAQVRTEEFVNYFRADVPPPTGGATFAIGLEAAPSLFGGDPRTEMLRVTVRGKEVAAFERQPLALTFVVDNSGSMQQGGRLELVKESLKKLLDVLAPTDSIAVVVFHQDASVLVSMTSAANRGPVEDRIASISIEGGTNVEAGLAVGYEHALANLTSSAVNRVVLFSDGVGNIGETQAQALLAKVDAARERGIYLNTFGVGMGNHNDAFLEELADKGDGLCQYLDSRAEAERALVRRFAETLQPIARDVKVQVEFDPTEVERWRLLGYENRTIADQKFRDDTVDAGEVNAGHQVTALYELVRSGAGEGPFATVRVRFKPPFPVDAGATGAEAKAVSELATEIERSIGPRDVLASFASASAGYRRAVLVAQLAECLRRSVHARGDSRDVLLGETRKLERELGEPEFSEFAGLVERALPLLAQDEDSESEIQPLLDELARLRYEQGQRELEQKPLAPEEEQDAARRIAELEATIRQKIVERHGGESVEGLKELGYTGEDQGSDHRRR